MSDIFNTESAERLRTLVSRIERLEEDKSNVATDIREVYAEAKANGFDPKIMRKIVQIRKKDSNKLEEEETLLDLYKAVFNL